jgi:adenosylcobinamide-phosphate synthase
MAAALLLPALLLDAALGEPDWLWRRLPHPAVLLGRAVGLLDRRLNAGRQRRLKGVLATALLVCGAGTVGAAIAAVPDAGLLEVLAAAVLLAQRSRVDHVRAVADALRLSVADGRLMVARIVGRDTAPLDGPGVTVLAGPAGTETSTPAAARS